MVRPVSSRARSRPLPAIELAIAFALVGSLLAVAVPAIARSVHASRLVEPVQGLQRLGASAVAYAHRQAATATDAPAFPASAPLTPPTAPRGRCEVDPPGTWSHPTWEALAFRPAPEDSPHCFAFAFDSAHVPGRSSFRAHTHGDLDGDGITSTFEVTGRYVEGDSRGPVLDPGMFVDAEGE
jgi:type II secretory pathway pseudopilin PulG